MATTPLTHTEPSPTDLDALFTQATRSDVVATCPLLCSVRWHGGPCVVETLSDGSLRHRETVNGYERVHVQTRAGLRRVL